MVGWSAHVAWLFMRYVVLTRPKLRKGGDDKVTMGEVITQEEFERLAASFRLTFGADGKVCDGLQ
jgi:hypothetical protein